MAAQTRHALKIKYPFGGNSRRFPLIHGLRAYSHRIRKRSLSSDNVGRSINQIAGIVHGVKIHPWFTYVYWRLIFYWTRIRQTKPMVDISGMPPTPHQVPDPEHCKDFADWLAQLTNKKGACRVRQTDVATVAGKTPQSVTKWLKGGSIEVDPLARISTWVGQPYERLRRLVDESKLKLLPVQSIESKPPPLLAKPESEIDALYRALRPKQRMQLLQFAHALLTTQRKTKK